MANYEIEIKSLLGDKAKADKLADAMHALDPYLETLGAHRQLNHYFAEGSLKNLLIKLASYLSTKEKTELEHLIKQAKDFSVRTRWADGKVILVIKVTVDDTTSSNGTARRELEVLFKDLSIDQLDALVLEAGFKYQAKWSRARQDYLYKKLNVSIDKNAGYGYLAEFESVITDQSKAEETKTHIREIMKELGVEELDQARLGRMFDYYNKHWQDYYGTDKTFSLE